VGSLGALEAAGADFDSEAAGADFVSELESAGGATPARSTATIGFLIWVLMVVVAREV
jgi:hypothetical protein